MNILNSFDSFLNEAKKTRSAIDLDSKVRSKDQLQLQGLPSRKDEAWRNTSLKFLSDHNFKPALSAPEVSVEIKKIFLEKSIPNSQKIVFINGFCVLELSKFNSNSIVLDQKLEIKTQSADDVSKLSRSLNDIYNLNPVEIIINDSQESPLQIFNFAAAVGTTEAIVSPKIKIVLKENKEAKIVLTQTGLIGSCYFNNGHFLFDIEKDARLTVVNHIDQSANAYHFDTVTMSAASASNIKYFELNFNALVTRHEFVLNLNGQHIQSQILGASYLKAKQHCDSQTLISHNQSHSQSEQIYKALLDDDSRSVFSGTVYIAQGIVKADSVQLNQNLLLSDRAEVNSKPILRIYADDVKASHGSTMGQVQEDEIFYLQSRSISRAKAIELLGQGFLNEIVFRLESEELKHYFSSELLTQMGNHRKAQPKALN